MLRNVFKSGKWTGDCWCGQNAMALPMDRGEPETSQWKTGEDTLIFCAKGITIQNKGNNFGTK
jgi:hypothetical protein